MKTGERLYLAQAHQRRQIIRRVVQALPEHLDGLAQLAGLGQRASQGQQHTVRLRVQRDQTLVVTRRFRRLPQIAGRHRRQFQRRRLIRPFAQHRPGERQRLRPVLRAGQLRDPGVGFRAR